MAAPKGNQFAKGCKTNGRPQKYSSVEEVQEIIRKYFADCKDKEEFPTITGLAIALNLTTQGLREYGDKEDFSLTIKKAKQEVEKAWEQKLLTGATGPIFWLKNNAGWKDKQEQEITGNMQIVISNDDANL